MGFEILLSFSTSPEGIFKVSERLIINNGPLSSDFEDFIYIL